MNPIRFFVYFFVAVLLICCQNQAQAQQEEIAVLAQFYSATISWTTDKPSTSQIEYGTSIKYGYPDITVLDTNLVTFHKVTLENLKSLTRYHYRVRSKDIWGNEAISEDFIFVSSGSSVAYSPPQISDVEARTIVAAGPAAVEQEEDVKGEVVQKKSVQEEYPKEEKSTLKQESASSVQVEQKAGQIVKHEAPIERALIEEGGLLLPRGKWQVEPSLTYAHVSANRISVRGFTILPILVIGEISSAKVKRDIIIPTLTTRYGLLNNLQWELKVPYRYQHSRDTTEGLPETTTELSGIGDIETGLYHQLLRERGWIPDLIVGLSTKSDTGEEPYGRDIGLGTGHWGVKTNLVAVKSSDPAILFGSLGYTYNVKRQGIPDYGTVKPGDAFEYSLGTAFALNYQLALNFQLEQRITTKMIMNHESVPGSFTNEINLKYGANWSISKDFSCDILASHGLTEDSPDFVLEVRFPYTF